MAQSQVIPNLRRTPAAMPNLIACGSFLFLGAGSTEGHTKGFTDHLPFLSQPPL